MDHKEYTDLNPEVILPEFKPLLAMLANTLTTDHNLREDLTQEGYIAMWKALKTFDRSRGALPAWLKYKAKGRMLMVLNRQSFLGQDKSSTGGSQGFWDALPVGNPSQDSFLDGESKFGLEIFGVSESLEYVAFRYHEGEILRALSELTHIQRDYAIRRFWHGQTNESMRAEVSYQPEGAWKQARVNLRKSLAHLSTT